MTTVINISPETDHIADMVTPQEKTELKKKMLDACIAKQQSLIGDFSNRIRSLTEITGLGNEESYDNTESAANAGRISEINTLNELLEFANEEMELLQNLKMTTDTTNDEAVLGAVVVTDSMTFLISVSIEEFEADGNKYFGISAHSPLFQAMYRKRKGETFSYDGRQYKIKDIY